MNQIKEIEQLIAKLSEVSLKEKKRLPKVSAVYLLVNNSEVLYVGHTEDLKTRWKSHECLKLVADKSGLKIGWFEIQGKSELLRMESLLCSYFNPPLNFYLTRSIEVLYTAQDYEKHAKHHLRCFNNNLKQVRRLQKMAFEKYGVKILSMCDDLPFDEKAILLD